METPQTGEGADGGFGGAREARGRTICHRAIEVHEAHWVNPSTIPGLGDYGRTDGVDGVGAAALGVMQRGAFGVNGNGSRPGKGKHTSGGKQQGGTHDGEARTDGRVCAGGVA